MAIPTAGSAQGFERRGDSETRGDTVTGTKQTRLTSRLTSVVTGAAARVDGKIGAKPRPRIGHALLGLAIVCLVTLSGAGKLGAEAQSSDYRLGVQDKLRIKVFEWRPSKDEMFEWAALNSEYTVGATGTLSLPIIGEVPVAGTSTADLAQSIAERFKERMGLAANPDITIEIVQFRPFYVVGQVEKPGEYPYRPGLSLMQAVSISGGHKRSLDANIRLEREIYATRGELNLYAREFISLLARRARLQAEMKGADRIEFPVELTAKGGAREIKVVLDNEQNLFSARHEANETQVANLRQQRADLEREVTSLTGQLASHDKIAQLVRSELEYIEALANRGLTTAPRRLALQRNVAQLDGDRLRLGSGLIKVRQEISKTEMSLIELRTRRTNEVASEMQVTQQRLEEVSLKAETAQNLLYKSRVIAPLSLASRTRVQANEPVYKVSRRSASGQAQELPATEWTILEPGDIIKVELPLIEDSSMPLPVRWDFLPSDVPPQSRPPEAIPEKDPPSARLLKEVGGGLGAVHTVGDVRQTLDNLASLRGLPVLSSDNEDVGWVVGVVKDPNGKVQALQIEIGRFLGVGGARTSRRRMIIDAELVGAARRQDQVADHRRSRTCCPGRHKAVAAPGSRTVGGCCEAISLPCR